MIGKIVDYIIQAGYDVSIHQYEYVLMLRITKRAAIGQGKDGQICAINWVISRHELAHIISEDALLEMCKDQLRPLQQELAGRK